MFPICWNILVFHAALTGLVIVGFIKLGQPDLYTPIHGDILSKEVDKLSGKDLMNFINQTCTNQYEIDVD